MPFALTAERVDVLGAVLGFVFTLALLSYLIGDNPLYRVALHIFIGVAVGYVALVAIYQVLRPRLITPLGTSDIQAVALTAIPLVIFLFLIMKLSSRTSRLGNMGVGYLVGVGVGTAVGGALTGTLLPQVRATWLSVLPEGSGVFIDNAIIVVGTIATLVYFQFWLRKDPRSGEARRIAPLRWLAAFGQGLVVITLGMVFGGMILSGAAILGDRLLTLYRWVGLLVQ